MIDDGEIGKPIGATAFFANHGWEWGDPDPEFFYKPGGGPILDMGPYYLTALIALLGPVAQVTGSARTTFSERTITSEPKTGQKIEVEVPTHVSGVLEFAFGYQENSRGIGVADMVDAIATGRPHRASGELMHRVVDIAKSLFDARRIGKHHTITSVCERPAPLATDLAPGEIR